MDQFAKCPECGNELTYEEKVDEYYTDTPSQAYIEKWRGFCPNCNDQVYSWFERYTLTERYNMKKEFENEI